MTKQVNLKDMLNEIDPASLSYQEWVNVGMALKYEGLSVADWEGWSRRDTARYHAGECTKKWNGFNGSASPVTGGTIVQYAREQGWEPEYQYRDGGRELDWNDVINDDRDELVVVDRNWIEEKELPEAPSDEWNPAGELVRYLELLFEASETVGYVTSSWQKDEKFLPTKGNWDRTAGELIEALNGCGGDIGRVLGDYNPQAGAWIRFNPLDGKGCKNENVTEFRYALVESDELPIEQQYAIVKQLELPVAVLVYSGKKSLHAIVRIEAANYDEYRKRVDYLYNVCQKNGLKIDSQNRNPSRLSRMPGVIRGDKKQYIVAENIGRESWETWREWIESINDELPDTQNLADMWDKMPQLEPVLIDGVLRQGHKMLLAGPSKAGKSYALIELCIAIAEGQRWLGWRCTQGRVLYVNLELAEASCWNRIKEVYTCMNIQSNNRENLDVWNLRGKSLPMDKLAPKLIRRAAKRHYIAIVIDPIYKVITGDENSADQMAKFCNQFDLVCTELGCAVIYCHHHSKGLQGQKRSMDRASGSGVFARDPDAMLDMIQLEPTEALLKQEGDKAGLEVCKKALKTTGDDGSELGPDALLSLSQTLEYCKNKYSTETYNALENAVEAARTACTKRTAWRIEGTLREFERFEPVNLWFDYPVHYVDRVGSLKDIDAEGEEPAWKKGAKNNKANKKKRKNDRLTALENAIALCDTDGKPTVKKVAEYLDRDESTIRKQINAEFNDVFYLDKNDGVIKRRNYD